MLAVAREELDKRVSVKTDSKKSKKVDRRKSSSK